MKFLEEGCGGFNILNKIGLSKIERAENSDCSVSVVSDKCRIGKIIIIERTSCDTDSISVVWLVVYQSLSVIEESDHFTFIQGLLEESWNN